MEHNAHRIHFNFQLLIFTQKKIQRQQKKTFHQLFPGMSEVEERNMRNHNLYLHKRLTLLQKKNNEHVGLEMGV